MVSCHGGNQSEVANIAVTLPSSAWHSHGGETVGGCQVIPRCESIVRRSHSGGAAEASLTERIQ